MMSILRRVYLAGAAAVVVVVPSVVIPKTSVQIVAADPALGVEVLARGPVHEAFAATLEVQSLGAPIVLKAPPEPIEELPPDQKPAGDNVQWIPGYWHYDEERTDYIWISGFWRVPPPGRVWFPGSWREVRGGFQWTHGFWQEALSQRPDLEYLTPPPAPVEYAPSVPAPSEAHIYVPGCWVFRNRYVWRPGFWVEHRPNWVWVPAHYRWTPAGYLFIEGYWDYPLAERGVLFAPVAVQQSLYLQPNFVYTPTIVVNEPCLHTSLFVRRGWGCYYFGDYFENRYTQVGFSSWTGNSFRGSGFGVSLNFGTRPVYDPLWSYYRVAYRNDQYWASNINDVYAGRYAGTYARPPRTLVQQNIVVNNITNVTNVTNNTVIINNNKTVNSNLVMLTNLNNVQATNDRVSLKPLAREERVTEQRFAQDLRGISAQRKQLETSIADRGLAPLKPNSQPTSAKLDVPKATFARAQLPQSTKPVASSPSGNKPGIVATPPTAALKPNFSGNAQGTPSLKPNLPGPMPPARVGPSEFKPNNSVPTPPTAGLKPNAPVQAPPSTGLKPNLPSRGNVPPPSLNKPSGSVPTPPTAGFKPSSPAPAPTFKPAPAPAPTFKPAPVPAPTLKPAPAPAPTFKPNSAPPAPAFKPAPLPTRPPVQAQRAAPPAPVFKPAPAPAPTFKPAPAPAFKPAPAPTRPPVQAQRAAPPAPVFKPAPAPVFKPAPAPMYKPATPSFKPAPSGGSLKPNSPLPPKKPK